MTDDKFIGTPIKATTHVNQNEDLSGPEAGSYSADGSGDGEEEF